MRTRVYAGRCRVALCEMRRLPRHVPRVPAEYYCPKAHHRMPTERSSDVDLEALIDQQVRTFAVLCDFEARVEASNVSPDCVGLREDLRLGRGATRDYNNNSYWAHHAFCQVV